MRNFWLLLILMAPMMASAGRVNKCVRADRVIYTDKACPEGTEDAQITAQLTSYSGAESGGALTAPSAGKSSGSAPQAYGASAANVRRVERALQK